MSKEHPQLKEPLMESDLISFGSYLLSDERERMLKHKDLRKFVNHNDIENWLHIRDNIQNQ